MSAEPHLDREQMLQEALERIAEGDAPRVDFTQPEQIRAFAGFVLRAGLTNE